jgi:hypothetical protein
MVRLQSSALPLLLLASLVVVDGGCANMKESAMSDQAEAAKAPEQATTRRLTGRCHCGHVAYEAQGPITKCSYCDCAGCRRATGTFKAPFVTVPASRFELTAGAPAQFRAASGEACDAHGTWHFCPKCGTQVYWMASDGKQIDLFAGTLDDASVFQPPEGS